MKYGIYGRFMYGIPIKVPSIDQIDNYALVSFYKVTFWHKFTEYNSIRLYLFDILIYYIPIIMRKIYYILIIIRKK